MKKIVCVFLIINFIFLMVNLTGCKKKSEKFTDHSFDYFDTVTTIIGYETNEKAFKSNCKKIKEKLGEYHQLYTIYGKYEDLNNIATINEVENGQHKTVSVDEKIIKLLDFGKEMHTLTKGKVNIAFGSVLKIWHTHRTDGLENPDTAKLPKKSVLLKAANHCDISNLIIDNEKNTVYISDPEMTLDVGAVAKGYATEMVARWMEENNMFGYLLNVGGNIRIVGKRADGEKWQIGVENPDTTNKEISYIQYLELDEMSLVTSGSYQRFYTVKGKNYHHIIDSNTLMPSEYFESVSVLCKDSAIADALSTALFSMPYNDGCKLVESLDNTYAMWVTKDGNLLYSKGFEKFCKK